MLELSAETISHLQCVALRLVFKEGTACVKITGPVAGWAVPGAVQCNGADHGSLRGDGQRNMHSILPSEPAMPPGVSRQHC